jgi:hypothetical protein
MFSESTCSGVSKISNLFLCKPFWVNKSLSMMCTHDKISQNYGAYRIFFPPMITLEFIHPKQIVDEVTSQLETLICWNIQDCKDIFTLCVHFTHFFQAYLFCLPFKATTDEWRGVRMAWRWSWSAFKSQFFHKKMATAIPDIISSKYEFPLNYSEKPIIIKFIFQPPLQQRNSIYRKNGS